MLNYFVKINPTFLNIDHLELKMPADGDNVDVYKPLHNLSDDLKDNGLGVRVGLGLDLGLSLSLLGYTLFPFFSF